MICLAQAVLPKRYGVLMPLFAGIDTYQPDSWCLVFSTGRVSHVVRDLRYFNVHRSLTAEHKAERKVVFTELLTCFKAEGETFPSLIVIAGEA